MVAGRFDVVLVELDPTRGHEMRKTRPCLVVSPNELNAHLATLIVAPMTTHGRAYPYRVPVRFRGKKGLVVLDQLRTVDRARIVTVLGAVDEATAEGVLATLARMFAP